MKYLPPNQTLNKKSNNDGVRIMKAIGISILVIVILGSVTYSLPKLLALSIQNTQHQVPPKTPDQFPVTVDPRNKIIVENDAVNTFLEGPSSPLQAAVKNTGNILSSLFEWIAVAINETSWYQNVAAVDGHFVTIKAGMRKEQVTESFSKVLGWNKDDKKDFVTPVSTSTNPILPLSEGSFLQGTYFVEPGSTALDVQTLMNKRFSDEVLSRYGESVKNIVPLEQALIIASLIERETTSHDDKRLISGIIWNRIFAGMKLQIDASLQYAKANNVKNGSWWPKVIPADKYQKSPYNTYIHKGLPPAPIASPSVAAIVAALNPIETPCLYYFNDKLGEFHCSKTYEEHVAQLKKVYGRGK